MLVAPEPPDIAKYRLVEEIGHGGMATVYRAEDKRLGRDVALKLIHRHLRDSPEIQARFTSEARAIAKLRHANIVEVFDVSDDDEEEHYLIMELVRGGTLRDVLHRCGALPIELAAMLVRQLASALEHAHGQGVIHRDIKPENVLVEQVGEDGKQRTSRPEWRRPVLLDEGAQAPANDVPAASAPSRSQGSPTQRSAARARVKLTDFGIAKLLDAQGVTSTGQVLGSPAHMAPEQIEGKPVDARADVFSLAVLFYETAVGALPFDGNNPAQVLRNVLEGRYRAADQVRPEIGAVWSQIITRALARDPEQRFPTVQAFGEAIEAELLELGFEDPDVEFGAFMVSPEGYREAFEERIVSGLAASAQLSRERRDLTRATAQLCRALAYRPGDSALLGQARHLRRRVRLQGAVWWGAGAAVLALLGVGGAVVVSRTSRPAAVVLEPGRGAAQSPALPFGSAAPPRGLAPAGSVAPEPAGSTIPERRPPRRVVTTATHPTAPRRPVAPTQVVEASRRVAVRVSGATGGSLKIDGRLLPWFGVEHELTVGEHEFEFVPPNDSCCVGSKRRVVIRAGEGTQWVTGRIPFKDAVLRATSPESQGYELSCPTLFGGVMRLPADRSVAMSQVAVTGTCTLVESANRSAPVSRSITLRAGATTLLPWP